MNPETPSSFLLPVGSDWLWWGGAVGLGLFGVCVLFNRGRNPHRLWRSVVAVCVFVLAAFAAFMPATRHDPVPTTLPRPIISGADRERNLGLARRALQDERARAQLLSMLSDSNPVVWTRSRSYRDWPGPIGLVPIVNEYLSRTAAGVPGVSMRLRLDMEGVLDLSAVEHFQGVEWNTAVQRLMDDPLIAKPSKFSPTIYTGLGAWCPTGMPGPYAFFGERPERVKAWVTLSIDGSEVDLGPMWFEVVTQGR